MIYRLFRFDYYSNYLLNLKPLVLKSVTPKESKIRVTDFLEKPMIVSSSKDEHLDK